MIHSGITWTPSAFCVLRAVLALNGVLGVFRADEGAVSLFFRGVWGSREFVEDSGKALFR